MAAAVVGQVAVVKMTELASGVPARVWFASLRVLSAARNVFAVAVVRLTTAPPAPVAGEAVRAGAVAAVLAVAVPIRAAAETLSTSPRRRGIDDRAVFMMLMSSIPP
jgi:hypothetical protein